MSILKRKVDWFSLSIQLVSVGAIGFALNWWAALALTCVWMCVNYWRYDNG